MKKFVMIMFALFAIPAIAACADRSPPTTGGDPVRVDCEVVEGVVTLTFPDGTIMPRPDLAACP